MQPLKSANYFEIMVSAAGFEPATHALKVLQPADYSVTLKKSE